MSEQPDLIALGERIRKLRGKESRDQFAQSFLAKASTLARWEAGESQPDLGFLIRLASAFNVSFEWLATGIGESPKNGKMQADKQFQYLDDIDWTKAKRGKGSDASPPQKNPDASPPDMRDDYIAALRQLADLQKENGDLRVEVERLRSRVTQLESDLGEALKDTDRTPPERVSNARTG